MVIGNRERLAPKLNEVIDSCMAQTAHNDTLTLIVFLSYSGKWDILNAAKKMIRESVACPEKMEQLLDMDVDGFDGYLATAGIPDPELIIRPSGEQRISNFLLWQSAYSEFVFMDVLWPDFGAEQLDMAIEEYYKRNRRFGGA